MCVVSFVGDHYWDKWRPQPWVVPTPIYPINTEPVYQPVDINIDLSGVDKQEIEKLKKEVAEMKELMRKAKIYDEKNNEQNCENDEKMNILRKIAEAVGIDLDEVLKK